MDILTRRIEALCVVVFTVFTFLPARSSAQDASTEVHADGAAADQHSGNGQSVDEKKRLLGIIPNYRTVPTFVDFHPLTSGEKFKIAVDDSFDRGTFVLAGLFAADAQVTDSTPSFGNGFEAYAKYYAASFSDLVIGDFMTEGIFPTALHQDPRYFRRGTGSGWARLGYAVGQIFWTHGDSGRGQFNFSEIGGNAAAVGIANAYYPGSRTLSNQATKLGLQLGVDMAANVLKEFWPDLDRLFSHEHAQRQSPADQRTLVKPES